MDDNQSSAVDKIAKLARSSGDVKSVGDRHKIFAVPEGIKLISEDAVLKPGLSRTVSIDRFEKVSSPKSFIDFVETYGTRETVVFLDARLGKATSIINYVPKQDIKKPVKNDKGSKDKAKEEDPILAYRCDWQVSFEHQVTPKWKLLNEVTDAKLTMRDRALRMTELKDSFFEYQEHEDVAHHSEYDTAEDQEESLAAIDKQLIYAKLFKAHMAGSKDFLDYIYKGKSCHNNLLINFSMPIHQGMNAVEIMLHIDQSGAKPSLAILEKDRLIQRSTQIGMADIRSKIGRQFNVFEADLSE